MNPLSDIKASDVSEQKVEMRELSPTELDNVSGGMIFEDAIGAVERVPVHVGRGFMRLVRAFGGLFD